MRSLDSAPEPLGVSPARRWRERRGLSPPMPHAIEFCLFEGGTRNSPGALRGRTGDVFHDQIADVGLGARYGLTGAWPFLPREGHWFNPAKLLLGSLCEGDRPATRLHPSNVWLPHWLDE